MSDNESPDMEENHIKSVGYGEMPTDIIMPDLLIPPPQTDETKTVIEDEVDVAFKFASSDRDWETINQAL